MTTANTEELLRLIEKFSTARILVIGDVMLDKYIWGEVTRISPEAPVPVVNIQNETYAPGGASNAAMNVAALGAQCYIIGLVGEDSAKDILTTLLNAKNINTDGLFVHKKSTIQKVRIMGNQQQLLRCDYEEKIENEKEKAIIEYAKKIADNIDVILVSDYAKGTISEILMNELKKLGKKIIVDPKPQKFNFYKDVHLIKPNEKEATELTGLKNTEEGINSIGQQLVKRSNANILLSQGKDGMTLFECNGQTQHLPATVKEAYDVTGAGDTVVALMAVCTAIGASLISSAILANHAAGIKVSKIGTVAISQIELREFVKNNSRQ